MGRSATGSHFANTPMGFAMTFDNGWTISVQWGPGNYCHTRHNDTDNPFDGLSHQYISPTAEIAVWDKDDNWARLGDTDDVKGWVSANDVSKYIAMVANPKFTGTEGN
jgi:hypothetical protein